ncbi:MAG: RluA family pseudouridine synthase [Pyrinomonadaceae bacterium]
MKERVIIAVPARIIKVRLEDFLLAHFPSFSKMYLRDLVKTDACEVNGRLENIGYRLCHNDLVEIDVDHTRGRAMVREDIPLDIVFEDDHLLVVNKPAGMLVHPSHRENSGTLLNALAHYLNRSVAIATTDAAGAVAPHLGADSNIRPGLPHRLDKQTSGLIVVAKTADAHRRLSAAFMKKSVKKRYWALVEGLVGDDIGTIESMIGRFDDLKYWGVKPDGKPSESRFRVLKRFTDTTLIEMEPVTGRTNQLRIHCHLIGHPIVGDVQRGGREYQRLCLHAYTLAFTHPVSRQFVSFTTGAPAFAGQHRSIPGA